MKLKITEKVAVGSPMDDGEFPPPSPFILDVFFVR